MLQKHKKNFITLFVLVAVGILSMLVVQAQTREARERATDEAEVRSVEFSELKVDPFIFLFESSSEFRAIFQGVGQREISRVMADVANRETFDVPAGTMRLLKPDFAYENDGCGTYAHSGNDGFNFAVEVGNGGGRTDQAHITIEQLDSKGQPMSRGRARLSEGAKSEIRVDGVSDVTKGHTLWNLCTNSSSPTSLFVSQNTLKVSDGASESALTRLSTESFDVLHQTDTDTMNRMKKARYKNLIKPKIDDILTNGFPQLSGPPKPLSAIKREMVENLDKVLEEKLGSCLYACFSPSLNDAINQSNFSDNSIANNAIKSGARNWVREFEAINGGRDPIYGPLPGSRLDRAKKAFWALLTGPFADLKENGEKLDAALKALTIPN